MDIKFLKRLGDPFNSNCFSYVETTGFCSACDAGYYFDPLTNACVQCSNKCFFCEPSNDFEPFKRFLLEQHKSAIDTFANQLYDINWYKEPPLPNISTPTDDTASTETTNTDNTNTDTTNTDTTNTDTTNTDNTNIDTTNTDTTNTETTTDPTPPSSKVIKKTKILNKIISSHDIEKEEDLKIVRSFILETIYNFDEIDNQTCPVCMKGFTQLESRTCIDTEIYSFSLGLSLF